MLKLRLAALLAQRGMSRADLARLTGIRPNTIGELYHNVAARTSFKQLDLICKALHCSPGELIVQEDD